MYLYEYIIVVSTFMCIYKAVIYKTIINEREEEYRRRGEEKILGTEMEQIIFFACMIMSKWSQIFRLTTMQ